MKPDPKPDKPIRLQGADYTRFRRQVHDRERGICQVCNLPAPIEGFNCGTVSHIIHRSRGGGDTLDNVRWEHFECHQKSRHSPRWIVGCYHNPDKTF